MTSKSFPPAMPPMSAPSGGGKPASSGGGATKSAQPKGGRGLSAVQITRGILYGSAGIVALSACVWNLQPYFRAAQMMIDWAFPGIPYRLLVAGVVAGGGWGLLQGFEVYHILLRHDRKVLRAIVAEKRGRDTLEITGSDDAEVCAAKAAYNGISCENIRTARRWSYFAYTIDLLICVTVLPPADSLRQFSWFMLTGQWGRLNWGNIGMVFAMMFIFEFMVRIFLYLNGQRPVLARAYKGGQG